MHNIFPSCLLAVWDKFTMKTIKNQVCFQIKSSISAGKTAEQQTSLNGKLYPQQILRFCRNVGFGVTPSCPVGETAEQQTPLNGKLYPQQILRFF
jgi:hypothetical protein